MTDPERHVTGNFKVSQDREDTIRPKVISKGDHSDRTAWRMVEIPFTDRGSVMRSAALMTQWQQENGGHFEDYIYSRRLIISQYHCSTAAYTGSLWELQEKIKDGATDAEPGAQTQDGWHAVGVFQYIPPNRPWSVIDDDGVQALRVKAVKAQKELEEYFRHHQSPDSSLSMYRSYRSSALISPNGDTLKGHPGTKTRQGSESKIGYPARAWRRARGRPGDTSDTIDERYERGVRLVIASYDGINTNMDALISYGGGFKRTDGEGNGERRYNACLEALSDLGAKLGCPVIMSGTNTAYDDLTMPKRAEPLAKFEMDEPSTIFVQAMYYVTPPSTKGTDGPQL